MNRRTRIAETVAVMTRLVDRGTLRNASAFTIATTLDKLQRACVKVGRMHEEECNGDHEKCPRCASHPSKLGPSGCRVCGGTGRKTDDEVKAWLLARDKAERRIERLLRDLGFLPPSDTTGNAKAPTWEIERDPRGGPLRIYEDQADRKRGNSPRVVFPVEGF